MSEVFAGLIKSLQDEAEGNKTLLIEMLESTSRNYSELNELMNKYIECHDAADVLKKESIKRQE